MSQMVEAAERGDFATARARHARLMPLMLANFLESNPIPVKAAMQMLGKMENRLRVPLVPLADAHVEAVRAALHAAGALG
jgi:4-hydroxy-tetrahydrodipicolinate synthase